MVPIEEPYMYGWECHQSQVKGTYIKYQIACAFGVLRIIDVTDPWPCAASDNTVSQELKTKMLPGECGMGDKAYRTDRIHWLVPRPGRKATHTTGDLAYNYNIHAVRQTIERLIKRIKQFNVIKLPWRWSIDFHKKCFMVMCKLVNLTLLTEPLGFHVVLNNK
jgi:hypothetical protein